MRHSGVIALYLVANGAVVYRYDALDHVGLSDGGIESFTLEASFESLRAAVETATHCEATDHVTLLPLSVASVAAYHLATGDSRIDRLVCMSGVVDARATFHRVMGEDYFAWNLEDLPHRVQFEGHEIDPLPMWHEERRIAWYGLEATRQALAALSIPVVSILGLGDEWVTVEEVRRVFDAARGGPRLVVQLPHVTHSIGRNPVALRAVLGELTRLVLDLPEGAELIEPSFEDMLDLRALERQREHHEAIQSSGDTC